MLRLANFSPHAFISFFFFFNDTATTEIYTLSLHDALPILTYSWLNRTSVTTNPSSPGFTAGTPMFPLAGSTTQDRKSTRLNSSHGYISYAVFCLKKKNKIETTPTHPIRCTGRSPRCHRVSC